MAAAIVEFMLSSGIETKQSKAAARVADSLSKGGYAPPGETKLGQRIRADTVKRWHNSALKGHLDLTILVNDELQWLKKRAASQGCPSHTTEEALLELFNMCKGYRILE